MKKIYYLILFLFWFAASFEQPKRYYISPTGNDANSATQAQNIATPWKTIAKGWTVLVAGDTLYMRGGTYPGQSQINLTGRSGTAAANIQILNYPGEFPVLDYTTSTDPNPKTGLQLQNANFIHLKGLRITGIPQQNAGYNYAMLMLNDNNCIIENCTFDHIGGDGLSIGACTNNLIYNCDAYDNQDPLSPAPYNGSNGFSIPNQVPGTSGGNVFRGCRAWWNCDDGFDTFKTMDFVTFDSCWSFWNGYIPETFTPAGNGDGFKVGQAKSLQTTLLRLYTRNLAFENRFIGFDQNFTGPTLEFPVTLYNNTAYKNVFLGFFFSLPPVNIIKNNIAASNVGGQVNIGAQSTQSNNSWQGFTVNDAQFQSVSSVGTNGPRQANGALPNLPYLKLAATSNFIDRGVNVGLPFNGSAPDLGAFETGGGVVPPTLTAFASATTILCNGDNSTVTVSGAGGVPPYQNTGPFTRTAGSWSFTIMDAAGTTATANVTISQPAAITATQSSTAILINGGFSTTTVTAGGGVPALQYQRDGGTFQSSPTFTNVPAGTHTIIVRDANSCTRTITYTLTQPTALVVSAAATVNPLLCFGATTSIVGTVTGGTTPYSYKLNGGTAQPSNTFANQGAGTYTLTVTDAGGAVQSATVTITQPTQITITQTSTAILVNGGTSTTTGASSGGTGAKTYSRDGGAFQSSPTFAGVLAGNHTLTVKDANGCTNTINYTITQPSALSATAVATLNPVTCFGNVTTITVTATGGTTPYTYSINGGAFQSPNTFTNRGAGTYTLTVKDAANVTFTTNLTITQPAQITITESNTTIAVNGGSSVVTFTSAGGTGARVYSLDGSAFQSSPVFSGVLAGNHSVIVRDANLCTNSFSFTITQPTALVLSASSTAISCNAGVSTVTLTATGGTTPYQYKVGAGSLQSSNLFPGLTAGTYTFTVQDAGGAIVSTSITITQPAIITISIAAGASAPATVTVTAGGGVGTLVYQLDASSFQSSPTFTNVSAGNHTVTVKDANNCTASKAFTVGAALGITALVNAILCNGGSAQVTIGGTGGVPPYPGAGIYFQTVGTTTYTIHDNAGHVHDTTIVLTQPSAISLTVSTGIILTNGGTTTATATGGGGVGSLQFSLDGGAYQSSNSFSGVSAGNHVMAAKDANGCIVTRNFTLSQPGILGISVTPSAILCYGQPSSVVVTASGGTGPYTGTGTFPTLAGTVTFSVRDQFGSQKDTIVTIVQPPQLTLSVSIGTILINGGTTSITGSGAGGTGSLQYSLDGGSYQSSPTFSGVSAGSHILTVKDANNCTNTNNFSITQPGELIIHISVASTLLCYNDSTNITITGTGGTLPYTGTGTINRHAGTYTISISDAFGAKADTIININQPSQITIAVATGTILVNGNSTTATVTAGGGTGGYTYSIDGGSYQGSNSFTGVLAGNHIMRVKDSNGCINSFNFFIPQPGILYITVTPVGSILCPGGTINVVVTGTGGTAPLTGQGTYVRGAGTWPFSVTDALGATHDSIITITEPTQVIIDSVNTGTISIFGGTTTAIAHAIQGTGAYQFKLDGGSYQSDSSFTGVSGGNHTITVKDANSCTGIYSFTIVQPPQSPAQFYRKGRREKTHYVQIP